MEINKEIIEKTVQMLATNLNYYLPEINEAYNNNEGIIEIKLAARYSFNKGKFKIQTKIACPVKKIKDNSVVWYDPEQRQMFEDVSKTGTDDA